MSAPPLVAVAARAHRIDSLRGVAILSVLVLHFTLAFGLFDSPLGAWLGKPLLAMLTLRGNYGVTLFFVVSGFLITRQVLAQEGALARIHWRRFYLARASRILPLLLLALALICALGWWAGLPFFGGEAGTPSLSARRWLISLASVLGFWHNLLMQREGWGYFHYCLNVYWSLSVEEAFYLLFPLLCRLLKQEVWIALAAGALVLAGPVYRATHAADEIDYLYAYAACFDAIAAGVLCALASRRWPVPRRAATALRWLAVVGMVGVWRQSFASAPGWTFSALAACAALWLWAAQDADSAAPGASGHWARLGDRLFLPLRWLGRYCYELYLFHILVLAGLRQVFSRASLLPDERLPLLAVYLLLSALVAWVAATAVGNPALRALRRRWAWRAREPAA